MSSTQNAIYSSFEEDTPFNEDDPSDHSDDRPPWQILFDEVVYGEAGNKPARNVVWNPLDYLSEDSDSKYDMIMEYDEEDVESEDEFFVPTVGREVGDDKVSFSPHKSRLILELYAQDQVFRMVTSQNDTILSDSVYNFCEQTSMIPNDVRSLYTVRKSQNMMKFIGFCDTPLLRTVIDVQKGTRSRGQNGSAAGKVSELAALARNCHWEARPMVMLCSYIQDSLLNTYNVHEPKYLFRLMGGTGSPEIFSEPVNTFLFMRAYRGGNEHRLYASAVEEMKQCAEEILQGRAPYPVLCNYLRMGREYLSATYADKVLIPVRNRVPAEPIHGPELSGVPEVAVMENRLARTKHILMEDDAVKEQNKADKFWALLFGEMFFPQSSLLLKRKESDARELFNHALRANTALQNLLQRKANRDDLVKALDDRTKEVMTYLMSHHGRKEFTIEHAYAVSSRTPDIVEVLNAFPRRGAVYVRDEVSVETFLKVGGIPLTVLRDGAYRVEYTARRTGLWQISGGMYDWAQSKMNEILAMNRPVFEDEYIELAQRDREWVQDDTTIIAQVLQAKLKDGETVVIISSDRRLCQRIASHAGKVVLRFNPEIVVKLEHNRLDGVGVDYVYDLRKLQRAGITLPPKCANPRLFLVDTGSLHAFISNFEMTAPRTYYAPKGLEVRPDRVITHFARMSIAEHKFTPQTFIPVSATKHRSGIV